MKTPKRNTGNPRAVDLYAQRHSRWKRKNRIRQLKHTIALQKRQLHWMIELLTIRVQADEIKSNWQAIAEYLQLVRFGDELPELFTVKDIEKLIVCPPHKRREKIKELREFNQKLASAPIYTTPLTYPVYSVKNPEQIKEIYNSNPYGK